jgi:hypothetical protein
MISRRRKCSLCGSVACLLQAPDFCRHRRQYRPAPSSAGTPTPPAKKAQPKKEAAKSA